MCRHNVSTPHTAHGYRVMYPKSRTFSPLEKKKKKATNFSFVSIDLYIHSSPSSWFCSDNILFFLLKETEYCFSEARGLEETYPACTDKAKTWPSSNTATGMESKSAQSQQKKIRTEMLSFHFHYIKKEKKKSPEQPSPTCQLQKADFFCNCQDYILHSPH